VAARLRLRDMVGAGPRAVSRYTGTLLAVHVVQLIAMLGCMLAIAIVLAQTFAHLPMWDDAVDGDLVALIQCLSYGKSAFLAIGGIAFGALLAWNLVSWFLVGGLYGVLAKRPEGRREVARCFGASGASTFLAYARLGIIQLPAYACVLFVLATGLGIAAPAMGAALTIPELVTPLALGTLPALLLLHFVWTVTDYVRVELALRQDSHDPGVLITYLRTLAYVAKRPVTLVHGGLGWILFVAVTLAYAYLATGHPMYGAEGAITIFVARQCVALLRTAIRFGVLGGQIELGRTRPLPPATTSETK
jgi:hypothetical protein